MADIIVSKKNESFINLDCELGILYELKPYFTFEVPGAKFHPKVKAKVWDGTISLLDLRFGTLPAGLFTELVEVAGKLGYVVEESDSQYGKSTDASDVSIETVENFISGLKLSYYNSELEQASELEVRDYQIVAIHDAIANQRAITIVPTGGGKSLIAYCLFRWYLEKEAQHFALVVPNISLIKQMYNDFKEYSLINGYDIDSNTQVVAEGASKQIRKQLVLATWQSIYKMPAPWLNQLDVILMDECHIAKADCVKSIFEKATEVKHRFGLTGSLDKSQTNKMVLRGLIGPIIKRKTTRDLINEGYLADIKIKCIVFKYSKQVKEDAKALKKYPQELDFICANESRNKFIRKLALSLKGVTLVLFNFVDKHGEKLYEEIKSKATTQEVHLVCGKVDADARDEIRRYVQSSNVDHVIVASNGTMSTGTNLPRINNIIIASPTKSVIRLVQSIGRGLRKSKDKSHLNFYDLSDVLGTKSKPNHTMRHFVERLRIYNEEEHDYKIMEIDLE